MADYDMRDAEPGKWVAGAGYLALGCLLIIASIALAINVQPLYAFMSFAGVYLIGVVIHDQVVRNWRLLRK